MLISERQAAERLRPAGVTYRQARALLDAGLAGATQRTGSATLVDEDAVAALASWPVLTDEDVELACPWGMFVARADRPTWDFSPVSSVWIRSRIDMHGHLPFVATVCGFVTRGAEITDVLRVRGSGYHLELRDPGVWFDHVREHRLLTGRGRPWALLGWQGFSPRLGTVGN